MSQLRQPRDYFKFNRTGTLAPRIHTFTVETNEKKKINQLKTVELEQQKRKDQDAERPRHSTTEYSCTLTTRENRHCSKTEK